MKVIFYLDINTVSHLRFSSEEERKRLIKSHTKTEVFELTNFVAESHNDDLYDGVAVAGEMSEDEFEMRKQRVNATQFVGYEEDHQIPSEEEEENLIQEQHSNGD